MTHQPSTHPIDEEETTAPILNVIDGRILVTSLKVVWDFKKSHKHVLRGLDSLVQECPSEFSRSNFGPREYKDERGKLQPIYDLIRATTHQ